MCTRFFMATQAYVTATTKMRVRYAIPAAYAALPTSIIRSLAKPSDSRPAIRPNNLVPTKLRICVCIANGRIEIVIHHDPAVLRVVVDALTAGSVDVTMRLEDDSAATAQAGCTGSIDLYSQSVSLAGTKYYSGVDLRSRLWAR